MKKLYLCILGAAVVLNISGCTSLSQWFDSLAENKAKPVAENKAAAPEKKPVHAAANTKHTNKKTETTKPASVAAEKSSPSKKELEKKAFNSQFSGWLGDYSQMKENHTATGVTSLLWVSPDLKKGKYKAIMIDPVGLYPRPPLLTRVTKGRMLEALTYIRDRAIKQIGSTLPVVDKPGPNVLRLDAAITSVKVPTDKDKLRDAKNTPVSMIFADISPTVAKQDQNLAVFLEVRLRDSQTKETLVKAVRAGTGGAAGKEKITVDHMKPMLNDWVQDADKFVREKVK